MKKIIILFLVLCGAGLGTSCDDFLTEHPSTQFSPEDVYSSPNGVQAVLNSCYGYISQSNGYGGYLHMLLSWHTPTMQLQNRNSTYMVELATMNVAVDNSTADYVYDGAYQTINTVNDLLMNIGLCSGMSEAEHNRIEGEARLLRALSYFNLVRIFGALPYIDRPAASIEESHKPRTSIDRIYGLIIGDLEQAWNMLPEKGAHAHGRPHNGPPKHFWPRSMSRWHVSRSIPANRSTQRCSTSRPRSTGSWRTTTPRRSTTRTPTRSFRTSPTCGSTPTSTPKSRFSKWR